MLYKYLGIDKALFLLENECLLFTPPKYFNDIYELLPTTRNEISDSEIIDNFLNEAFIARFLHKNKQDSINYIDQAKNNTVLLSSLKEKILMKNRELAERTPEIMSRHVGVFALTKNPLSNTMWAHYSENHTGICIGFDFQKTEIVLIENRDVEYRSQRVILPNSFITYSKEKKDKVYAEICFTKGLEWKYEDEHRFLISLDNCDRKKYKDVPVFTIQFNPADIKKLYFGKRTSLFNKHKLRKLLPDTDLVEVETSKDKYQLVEKNAT